MDQGRHCCLAKRLVSTSAGAVELDACLSLDTASSSSVIGGLRADCHIGEVGRSGELRSSQVRRSDSVTPSNAMQSRPRQYAIAS